MHNSCGFFYFVIIIFTVLLCAYIPTLGPGPGRYKLPACVGHSGHDPTRKTMPAFSFGKRLENSSELVKNITEKTVIDSHKFFHKI